MYFAVLNYGDKEGELHHLLHKTTWVAAPCTAAGLADRIIIAEYRMPIIITALLDTAMCRASEMSMQLEIQPCLFCSNLRARYESLLYLTVPALGNTAEAAQKETTNLQGKDCVLNEELMI